MRFRSKIDIEMLLSVVCLIFLTLFLFVEPAEGKLKFEDVGTAREAMTADDSLEYRLATIQWEPSDSMAFAKAEKKYDQTSRKQKKQKKSKPGAYNWTTRSGLDREDVKIWVSGKVYWKHSCRCNKNEPVVVYKEAKWKD